MGHKRNLGKTLKDFTVILPTFQRNNNGFLGRAIESVLAQTHDDFDLFIVDDGSKDGSEETIQKYVSADSRVNHIRFEENQGLPALTCVRAFLQSESKFVAWMFDDCAWDPYFLATMYRALEERPEVSIAYSDCAAYFGEVTRISGGDFNRDSLIYGNNNIPNVGTVIRRELFFEIGWYDPRIALVRCNDWDFLCRAAKAGVNFYHHPKVLAHEYGPGLADSLGNIYGTNFDLITEITSCDRSAELQPANLEFLDVLSLPSGLELSPDLVKAHLRLVIEFAIWGWRESIFQRITSEPNFTSLGIPISEKTDQIRWWAAENAKATLDKLQKNHDYIMGQREEIDKKQLFIDETQIFIAENEATITDLNFKIASLESLVLSLQHSESNRMNPKSNEGAPGLVKDINSVRRVSFLKKFRFKLGKRIKEFLSHKRPTSRSLGEASD